MLMPPPSWIPTRSSAPRETSSTITPQQSELAVAVMRPKHTAGFVYLKTLPGSFSERVNMASNGVELHPRASQSSQDRLQSWTVRVQSAPFKGKIIGAEEYCTELVVTVEGTFTPADLGQQDSLLEACSAVRWQLSRTGNPTNADLAQYKSLFETGSRTVVMTMRANDLLFSCGPWPFGTIRLQGLDQDGTPTVQVEPITATFTIEEAPQSLF